MSAESMTSTRRRVPIQALPSCGDVLAAAELARADWLDVSAAIAAGHDVTSRISLAGGAKGLFGRGFHPSAVCRALGAAAGAGRVLKLAPLPSWVCPAK
jgi:2-methylcitrate dehydratase PrpD